MTVVGTISLMEITSSSLFRVIFPERLLVFLSLLYLITERFIPKRRIHLQIAVQIKTLVSSDLKWKEGGI